MTVRSSIAMTHRETLRAARGQLALLAEAERVYLQAQPYRLIHGYDPRGGVYSVRVEVVRDVPAEVPVLAASVLRNAGAALDALAATLVPADAAAGPPRRFPIYDSLPQFAQRTRRSLAAMPDEVQATLEELQPYHTFGGFRNDLLWLLRELAASTSPPLAAGALRADSAVGVNTARHVEITGDLRVVAGAFEHGKVVVSVTATVAGPDPKLDLYVKPVYELALARDGPARGAALVGTLGALCDHVEQTVFARLS